MQKQITYLEDDPTIRDNYSDMLRDEGFEVHSYGYKEDALAAVRKSPPDLALLDVALHGERDAGFQVCAELRTLTDYLPIIFLTSHDSETDQISALRLGADDYISKDASIDYIVVRIEALFRRMESMRRSIQDELAPEVAGENLYLDDKRSLVFWKGSQLALSLTQYWIVKALHDNIGDVSSHEELMHAGNLFVEPNTIAAHIKNIRREFNHIDPGFNCIKTERGRGYRWIID